MLVKVLREFDSVLFGAVLIGYHALDAKECQTMHSLLFSLEPDQPALNSEATFRAA